MTAQVAGWRLLSFDPDDGRLRADAAALGTAGPALDRTPSTPDAAARRDATSTSTVLTDWAVPGVPRGKERSAPAPVASSVVGLRQAVLGVLAAPATGQPQDLAALLTTVEQLRGRVLRELGELDASGRFADEAVSAAAWLRRRQQLGDDTARGTVRLARRMAEDLPELLEALETGQTTLEHVRAVAAGTAGLDPAVVADAQPALLDLARAAEPAVVRRQLRERAEAISPQLARDAARRQVARQGLFADTIGAGAGSAVALSGQIAGEDGAVVLHGLDLCVEASRTAGDLRTLPARRAAVLVDWAREAVHRLCGPGDSGAQDAHAVRTHLLVTCTPDQLAATAHAHAARQLVDEPDGAEDRDGAENGAQDGAEDRQGDGHGHGPGAAALDLLTGATPSTPPRLASTGAALLPEALRRLSCDAAVSLLAAHRETASSARRPLEPPAQVLYAGRALRTVTAAQWKALVVRDRTCVVAGCARCPTQCEAHHVRHWLDGGASDLDNLVLLCHVHHHDHHDRGHDLPHRDGRRLTRTGWGTDPP